MMVHCLIVKGNRVFARAYLRSRCQRGSDSYQSWTSDHRQNQKICLLCNLRGCMEGDIPSTVGCGAPIFLRNIETVKRCFQLTQFSLNFPERCIFDRSSCSKRYKERLFMSSLHFHKSNYDMIVSNCIIRV